MKKNKKKYYLVTGAAGFIGFSLCRKLLLDPKKNIIGLDSLNKYYSPSLKKNRLKILKKYKNFRFIKDNLLSIKNLKRKIGKIKIKEVFHLAAQAGVRHSIDKPRDYLDNNIIATYNILELIKQLKISHLVLASTSSVYGDSINTFINENHETNKPIQFYAATKKSCELMSHAYHKIYGFKCTVVRFFTVYGPWGRPDMALFKFVKNIIKKKPISIFNQGKHSRNFTYIDDVVSALIKISEKKDKKNYNVINIGNNKTIKLIDFIKEVEIILGTKAKKIFLPLQKGDVPNVRADVSKLEKYFNYKINTDISYGIRKFVDWYKEYYRIKN
jgi:UDP-glucuronate 4-epimerase